MLIKTLHLGPLETNCYVVTDESSLECAVIDPGDESNTVLDYLEEHKLICRYIFLTHGHFDHTTAAEAVGSETDAVICIHKSDTSTTLSRYTFHPLVYTRFYEEGDVLYVGDLAFQIMETPGHSPGSVSLLCGQALFCGDTLFRDSCGRTDLPGGDERLLMRSLKRLAKLDGQIEVYPGHMGTSSIERELLFNPFLRHAIGLDSSSHPGDCDA